MKRPVIFNNRRRRLFIQLVANAIGQASALFIKAAIIRWAFDHLLHSSNPQTHMILYVGAGMAVTAVGGGWLHRQEKVVAERLGQSYIHNLRLRLFSHTTHMEYRRLQKKRRGAIMLKFIGDLNAIRRWISLGLVRMVVSSATIVSTLAVLALIAPSLAVAAALFIAAGIWVNARTGESLRRVVREARRHRSRLSANINEKVAQMAVVQVYGRTEAEIARLRKQSNKLRRSLIERAAMIGSIRGSTYAGTALAAAAVLTVGLLEVNHGRTTPGTVAGAMAVMGHLLPALKNLGRVYEYYQDAQVSRHKIDQFLGSAAHFRSPADAPDLAPGPGGVVLENVSVKDVLQEVSLDVAPGSVAVLAGPNGSGKSTLVGLISRMVKSSRGRVLIDGQDITAVSLPSLQRAVGIVSPDLPLLAGTVEMNLRYRCPDCDAREVERVKQVCGIEAIIHSMQQRHQDIIHEGGRNLSAGERQRIMLARAILGTPRVLLLDEVDAHLDKNSRLILEAVIRTYPGTVLWISHRLIPAAGVQTSWWMERGRLTRVTDEGSLLRAVG